jgi:hypothetical protein
MVGIRIRGLATLRHRLALKPPARRVCFLCLLCCSRSHTAGILLPPHAAGVLWAPASAPVAALLCFGGDLHPLLWDVRQGKAIDSPLPAIPCGALGQEGAKPDQHLLLLAPSSGTSWLHCGN